MKQQKRKGFTLVELLVVIAILAVLATVSIVGYTSFIKKANVSNDTALVTQLNTLMLAEETVDGQPATMYDALATIEENGFLIEKLTPTTDNHYIVWNSETNRFLLLDEQYEVVAPQNEQYTANKTFAIVHNQSEFDALSNFARYLADDFTSEQTEVTVSTGLDVGNYTGFTTITYSNTNANDKVIIRTNDLSTKLTINAPNDTVAHYGKVNEVLVNAVASSSYHEHGKVVGSITLNYGRVVVENGSEIESIVIDAEASKISSSEVVIAVSNSTSNNVPIIVSSEVKAAIENAGGENVLDVTEQNIVSTTEPIAIGNVGYTNLENALANVKDGETIILLQDVEFSGEISNQKSFAINMNNHNITIGKKVESSDGTQKPQTMTISNAHVKFVGNGMIMSSDVLSSWACSLIYIDGSANESDIDYTNVYFGAGIKFKTKNNNSEVSGKEVSVYGCYAYGVVGDKTRGITITYAGEILDGWGTAINGSIKNTVNAPTFIFEEGAKVSSIYGAGYANWIINGGTFSGNVEFCAGNIVINGGDFMASGEKSIDLTKTSQSCTTGYALAIVGRSGYSKVVSCTINGGNFNTEIVAINQIPEDYTCILTVNDIGENKGLLNSKSTYVVPQGMKVTQYTVDATE